MFTQNYVQRTARLALVLIAIVLAQSCGGNLGVGLHQTDGASNGSLAGGAGKSAALISPVPESEIGALPARQRQLHSDPGWNQPYITPPSGTPVPPPDLASLGVETGRAVAQGAALNPRFTQGAAKGASWYGDSAGPFSTEIEVGEYENHSAAANPPFGCNNDGGNASAAGNAIEDLIAATAASSVLPVHCMSYVREGLCAKNYFNTLLGSNKNASAAVYQAYCSTADGGFDPQNPPVNVAVAEISYRSSLVPDGGSTCAATAYLVSDYFWRAFNSKLHSDLIPDLLPNSSVNVYDVLIAPSGPVSPEGVSSGDTTGAYQPFYFGSMSACYGGAWIIGLTASNSACATFKGYFDPADYVPTFWHRPIYGVLLQRWLDMAPVDGQPWLSELGWPVYGPVTWMYPSLQLNSRGAYYVWGMWFEKGFIWWVDYDQGINPTVPDEAQTYYFTGSNIYCAAVGDELIKAGPVQRYGGNGPLGVNISVDGTRLAPEDPWLPARLNVAGTEYHIALPDPRGLSTAQLLLHARGYGGQPDAECQYKTYVWAFRDGTVQPAGADYDIAQRTAVHTYGDLSRNKESVYVVRVQVQDEVGFAYGDSLPIVIGHYAPTTVAEILVIRDDAPGFNIYNMNFDALLADLDTIGITYAVVNYTPAVAADFVAEGYKAAIWYRGGPGKSSEPDYTVHWTADEETAFNTLLGHKMLLISQAHGSVATTYDHSYWGWDSDEDSQLCRRIDSVLMTHATNQNMGLKSNEIDGVFGWLYVMYGSEMGAGQTDTRGAQRLGLPGNWGEDAAELYSLAGSSGKIPELLLWSTSGKDVLQFCARGRYPPFGTASVNPGWSNGMQANPAGDGSWQDGCYGAAVLSYGCSSTGGPSWQAPGPGRFWCWGMPYAKLEVKASSPAGMTRAEVLRNVLSWLDDSLTFPIPDDDYWRPYAGTPEIVSVKPGYWTSAPPTYIMGTESVSGVDYPDPTSADVLKTDYANSAGERYIATGQDGNTGLNTNDIDFQFPWYAYITNTNGTVETSADTTVVPPPLSTDDAVAFEGLLVSDPDQNWARYTPTAGQLPNVILNYGNAGQPLPAVAGCFTSTAGNTGDETFANYGTDDPALSWDNNFELECEVIAHWPKTLTYGTLPAKLYWSMFPGHRMLVPGTSAFLTDSVDGWYSFRKLFDIDPTVAGPPGRSTSSWNASPFQYTSLIGEGRVVSFNYRSINNWNPDLNYDNDANTAGDAAADKFPIRCRLFTDYRNFLDSDPLTPGVQPYIWPNNQPPTTTYVEGGCYVTDIGNPVFSFRILDDPAQPDPQDCVNGGAGFYTITFKYILKYGVAPYTSVNVEFDPEFNNSWGNPGSYVYSLALNIPTGGPQSNVLILNGTPDYTPPPAGSYWITLRGIDGDAPGATDYYKYINSQLVLMP